MTNIEPKDPIAMQIRSSSDWTYVVVFVFLFPLSIWCIFWGFADLKIEELEGVEFYNIVKIIYSIIGAPGFQAIALIMAIWIGSIGIGAAWRLRDKRPSLVAGPESLVFHPSICRNAIRWQDIERLDITRGRPTHFKVTLNKRHISLYSPFSSRHIEIPLMVSGWSYREARANVSQMRAWKKRASKEKLLPGR